MRVRGSELVFAGNVLVGRVMSGGYGWRTDQSLAVGWISTGPAQPGTALDVEIVGVRRRVIVAIDPIYDPENLRLLS